MMKKIIFVFLSCFFFFPANSQEKEMKLSLKEAIDFAIENNYNIKVSKKEIEIANNKVWETTAIGLPQVNASIDYQNFLKQPVSLLPADALDNTSSVVETVEDYFSIQKTKDPVPAEGFIPVVFGNKQNINASITLTQLIFDGSYLVGLQASKTFLKISKQANEKTKLLTREAVINAYGNVLVTESNISILEKNIKVLKKNYNDAKEIFENGFNEEEDVEQLEITLGNLKNQLHNVLRMKEIAYYMLNLSMGSPINTKLILTDSLDSLAESNIDISLMYKMLDVNDHIDFKIAKNDNDSKRMLLKLERSKALPSFSFFLNYGTQAFSETFSFFNNDQRWFQSSLLGVSLNVPIFSSFSRKSRATQAKISLENSKIRLEETEQRLNLLAKQAKSEFQLSIENYRTAKKNIALAEKIENKQRIKFFEGISSSFDLLQAQNQLYSQQQNYIQSMLDIISKKAKLENALNIEVK